MDITHAFVSGEPDGPDPDKVQASHWNADHVVGVGTPVAIGTANAEGVSGLLPRLDHVHAHPQFVSGDLHTEYALADGSRAITGKQDFQAGIRVDTIEELTLDAGVTIDTALIKDGCFQVPSGSFQGLKNSSGLLVLNVSQSSLWNAASSVAAATWGVLWAGGAHMMCQTPDIVGAASVAPIGGQNFCSAPSVCVGAFYADKAIATEAYISWWFEAWEKARLNVQGPRFEFEVLSAGTLTPVLGIDINGVDVTGTVDASGLITASAGLKLAAGQAIKDSEAVDRLLLRVAGVYDTGDVQQIVGNLRLGVAGYGGIIQGIDGSNRIWLAKDASPPHVKILGDLGVYAQNGLTAFYIEVDSPRLTWVHTGTNPRNIEMAAEATAFEILNRTDGNYIFYHWLASQVNCIPGPALIGAAASPESGYALELRDDFLLGAYFQDLGEIATPAAPAANRARFYAKDNGAGKTQLVVLFPTGAEQVLATEP